MAKQNRTTLKGYFETGDIPNQSQYSDLIDSKVNLSENNTGDIQLTGNMTASGDISATGYISGSNLISATHITASGDISASGNIYGSTIYANRFESSGSATSIDIVDNLDVTGHITASGNISASGTIYADNFQSTGGDAAGISFTDDLNLTGNLTSSGNISGSSTSTGSFGRVEANTLTGTLTGTATGLAGIPDIIVGTITANEISSSIVTASVSYSSGSNTFGEKSSDTHTFTGNILISGSAAGNITASGNISASGHISASSIDATGTITAEHLYSSDDAEIADTLTVGTITNVSTTHVTASGNISSSGIILGSTATFTEYGNISASNSILTQHITASGNISASGNIQGVSGSFQYISASGNISASGTITALSFTGSLLGTATTASYVTTAQTASYVTTAQTASYATTAQTASYVTTSQTASYVTTAQTASYVTTAQTASYATTAQTASYVTTSQTASYATTAQTASYVTTAQTASYVTTSQTASYVTTAQTASYISGHITASGNISASGNITSSGLYAQGDISASGNIQGVSGSFQYITASKIDVDAATIRIGGESFSKTHLTSLKAGKSIRDLSDLSATTYTLDDGRIVSRQFEQRYNRWAPNIEFTGADADASYSETDSIPQTYVDLSDRQFTAVIQQGKTRYIQSATDIALSSSFTTASTINIKSPNITFGGGRAGSEASVVISGSLTITGSSTFTNFGNFRNRFPQDNRAFEVSTDPTAVGGFREGLVTPNTGSAPHLHFMLSGSGQAGVGLLNPEHTLHVSESSADFKALQVEGTTQFNGFAGGMSFGNPTTISKNANVPAGYNVVLWTSDTNPSITIPVGIHYTIQLTANVKPVNMDDL